MFPHTFDKLQMMDDQGSVAASYDPPKSDKISLTGQEEDSLFALERRLLLERQGEEQERRHSSSNSLRD